MACIACLAAIATLFGTLYAVYGLHVPMPYRDEWYTVIHFEKFETGDYGLSDLASQHNEHRLLFPRLVFFADERLFHLSGVLDATVTVALQVANTVVLLALGLRRVARLEQRAALAGFVILALFTLRQEQNFTNGFQLQFVGVFTATLLAGVAYTSGLSRLGQGWNAAPYMALAAAGCIIATYTMANGVLAGFVLAGVSVLWRARWTVTAWTVGAASVLAALFFKGYVPGEFSLPANQALSHPLRYLAYVIVYVGNPVADRIHLAQCLGSVGLALAVAAVWRTWFGRLRNTAELSLLALALFILASAAATAYGRITLGIEQASESRYATPGLLFWCAIVLYWYPIAAKRRATGLALSTIVVVISTACIAAQATAWPELRARSAALRNVADSLESGLYDATAADTYENMSAADVAPFIPFIRDHHLGPFADAIVPALGLPSATLGPTAPPGTCVGTVMARADTGLGSNGVALAGIARSTTRRHSPKRILLADEQGTIIGFGSGLLPGRPPKAWQGYARAKPGDIVHALGMLPDGSVCDIGSATVAALP